MYLICSYYTDISRCTVNKKKTFNSYFCVSVRLQRLLDMAYSCVAIRHMNGIQFK